MTFSPTAYPGPLKCGDKGDAVELLQAWLNLWGYACAIDGDFGPETEHAVMDWQASGNAAPLRHLIEGGWHKLTAPLAKAMAPLPLIATHNADEERVSLGEAVAAVTRQWLVQSVGGGPLRELPGNSGPVVEACTRWLAERDRLPCVCRHQFGSHEAASGWQCIHENHAIYKCEQYTPNWRLPWRAGWVSTILRQACDSLGAEMPIAGSLDCDELARQANEARMAYLLQRNSEHSTLSRGPQPGDLFLVRGSTPGGWTNCGVVLGLQPKTGHYDAPTRTFIRTAEVSTAENEDHGGARLIEGVRLAAEHDYICWSKA